MYDTAQSYRLGERQTRREHNAMLSLGDWERIDSYDLSTTTNNTQKSISLHSYDGSLLDTDAVH